MTVSEVLAEMHCVIALLRQNEHEGLNKSAYFEALQHVSEALSALARDRPAETLPTYWDGLTEETGFWKGKPDRPAETPAGAMTLQEKIDRLVNGCKAGVSITFNDHRSCYRSLEDYLSDDHRDDVPPELAAQMIATDTIVEVQFYPRTPVGFHYVADVSLEDAIDRAVAILELEKTGA